jgi:DNA ligase-1
MLAVAIDEAVDFPKLSPADYAAEWKWDGIRVQAVREQGVAKLYSRTGDEISGAFPDVMAGLTFEGAIDGELLVWRANSEGVGRGGALRRSAAAAEPQDGRCRS